MLLGGWLSERHACCRCEEREAPLEQGGSPGVCSVRQACYEAAPAVPEVLASSPPVVAGLEGLHSTPLLPARIDALADGWHPPVPSIISKV